MAAEITPIARLKTLARLRRVNRQLSLWDELDAQALMPRGASEPQVRPAARRYEL